MMHDSRATVPTLGPRFADLRFAAATFSARLGSGFPFSEQAAFPMAMMILRALEDYRSTCPLQCR